jgi:hypothetical protein
MLRRTSIATLLVLLAATAAHAQTAKNDADSAIRELVRLSGVSRHVQAMASQARSELRERDPRFPDATLARIDAALGAAFAPKVVNQALVEGLQVRFDVAGAAATLRWLRSPLGRRVSQLDTAAAGPEMATELRAYIARSRTAPPDQERLLLTRRLEASTDAGGFAVELVAGVVASMGRALDPLLPPAARMKPGEMESTIAGMRAQLEPQLREAILMTLLFTYRSLRTSELAEVVAFYESDAGLWYTTATGQALLDVMQAAAARLAVEIAAAR